MFENLLRGLSSSCGQLLSIF